MLAVIVALAVGVQAEIGKRQQKRIIKKEQMQAARNIKENMDQLLNIIDRLQNGRIVGRDRKILKKEYKRLTKIVNTQILKETK